MKTETRQYLQRARAQAAEDTGRRIEEAFLSRFMTQWFDEITLDHVAADAGVTVQTVVRRFGGKEGLLSVAVKRMAEQILAQRAAPPGDMDLLVENLVGDYERTGDAVIRLLALEGRHPGLKTVLELGRREHRQWAGRAFAGELNRIGGAERERALDALVIVTDAYTWKLLRRDMGRSVCGTEMAMKRLVEGVLERMKDETD